MPRMKSMGKKLIDLTGQTFGSLTVVGRFGSDRQGYATWRCRCTCGNTTAQRGEALRNGRVVSCGCKKYDRFKK